MSDASLAERAGIPIRILRAIRQLESGGRVQATRFEPHVFNRLTSNRYAAQIPFTPDPGRGVSLIGSETNRAAFEHARQLDADAATRSTSWGLYQVLGGHLIRLYGTSARGVAEFDRSPARVSDELLVEWFRRNTRAAAAARDYDIDELARIYNGSTRWRDRMLAILPTISGETATAGGTILGVVLLGGAAAWFGARWLARRRRGLAELPRWASSKIDVWDEKMGDALIMAERPNCLAATRIGKDYSDWMRANKTWMDEDDWDRRARILRNWRDTHVLICGNGHAPRPVSQADRQAALPFLMRR